MELLTEKDVARSLKISHRTLQVWRRRKKGPPFISVGGAVRYLVEDLQNWVQSQRNARTRGPVA